MFWEEHWLGSGRLMSLFPRLYRISNLKFCTVNHFMLLWRNLNIASEHFCSRPLTGREEEIFQRLVTILYNVTCDSGQDKVVWSPGKGMFSSKVFSQLLYPSYSSHNDSRKIWKLIWSSKLPPKIAIFMWKIQWGVLPTNLFLNLRLSSISPLCGWCKGQVESMDHLFCSCSLAKLA